MPDLWVLVDSWTYPAGRHYFEVRSFYKRLLFFCYWITCFSFTLSKMSYLCDPSEISYSLKKTCIRPGEQMFKSRYRQKFVFIKSDQFSQVFLPGFLCHALGYHVNKQWHHCRKWQGSKSFYVYCVAIFVWKNI